MEPERRLARDAGRGEADRPTRVRPPVDMGPRLRDLRRNPCWPISSKAGRRSRRGPPAVTERTRLGLLVGANTFRNPGLTAKSAATLDHISGGRAILGVGGAWFGLEHLAHGIEFGTGFGQRLDWMDESVGDDARASSTARHVTSAPGGHYGFDDLRPFPAATPADGCRSSSVVPARRRRCRSVAKYADMWNALGPNSR